VLIKIFWSVFIFLAFFMPISVAQETNPTLLTQAEEVDEERENIISLGISAGTRFLSGDVVEFGNSFYPSASLTQDAKEDTPLYGFQLSFHFGLDKYLISTGVKIDYSYVKIDDVSLEARVENTLVFEYKGGFLSAQTIGFIPMIEFRGLTLIDYLFKTDLPTWFEIYLYGGPRININLYEQSDLKLDNLDTMNIGFEGGGGFELFLADNWSLKLEFAYYTNSTDFAVTQSNTKIFSGDLNLDAIKVGLELNYYF
jgi:opacity protein-like surface antigen